MTEHEILVCGTITLVLAIIATANQLRIILTNPNQYCDNYNKQFGIPLNMTQEECDSFNAQRSFFSLQQKAITNKTILTRVFTLLPLLLCSLIAFLILYVSYMGRGVRKAAFDDAETAHTHHPKVCADLFKSQITRTCWREKALPSVVNSNNPLFAITYRLTRGFLDRALMLPALKMRDLLPKEVSGGGGADGVSG